MKTKQSDASALHSAPLNDAPIGGSLYSQFSYYTRRALDVSANMDDAIDLLHREISIDKAVLRKDVPSQWQRFHSADSTSVPRDIPTGAPDWSAHRFTPVRLFWDVTSSCNLNCPHCYAPKDRNPSTPDLTTTEALAAIRNMARINPYLVEVGGGEPLLRADILVLLSSLRETGVRIKLLTNGTLQPDHVLRCFPDLLDFVQVSLDGAKEHHDSFRGSAGAYNQTLHFLRFLRDHGVPFGIACTLTPDTIPDLDNLVQTSLSLGAQKLRVFPVVPCGRGSNYHANIQPRHLRRVYERLAAEHRRLAGRLAIEARDGMYGLLFQPPSGLYDQNNPYLLCGAWKRVLHVGPAGTISPCNFLNHPDFHVGNIKTDDLYSLWTTTTILPDLRFLQIHDIQRCSACSRRVTCGAGLRCNAHGRFRNIRGPDPNCVYATSDDFIDDNE